MGIAKFKSQVTEHWVPALITGVFGLVVGLSVSLIEAELFESQFILEKRATTADRVALQFSRYIENWRRIIELKEYVASEKRVPSSEEIEQLRDYVTARDSAREALLSALDALHLYFKEDTSTLTTEFRKWDEQQSKKTTNDLPAISEWQSKGRRILLSMRKELL